MIEPVDFLLYLYYECSDCGSIGDEMRLSEVQTWGKHVCPTCGNVDELEKVKVPISKITASESGMRGTDDPIKPSKLATWEKDSLPKQHRPVYRQCVALGFPKLAVKEHILDYIYHFPDALPEDVFKKVIGEFQ